jgi:hypothetical protein
MHAKLDLNALHAICSKAAIWAAERNFIPAAPSGSRPESMFSPVAYSDFGVCAKVTRYRGEMAAEQTILPRRSMRCP